MSSYADDDRYVGNATACAPAIFCADPTVQLAVLTGLLAFILLLLITILILAILLCKYCQCCCCSKTQTQTENNNGDSNQQAGAVFELSDDIFGHLPQPSTLRPDCDASSFANC
ncbi:hypothetical protein BOX15_Mlig008470g1 [Macrostomum lignano]|uniref:Protein shisa-like-2A n=2 Tax=Macrostomum lignano TaxID=282301 RepID=A0A1I8H3R9_9PLAT|nr:hypothetical protein BOX15_Mlig008470g1 [Macrostomum lignano]